jgi:hypothetical protein
MNTDEMNHTQLSGEYWNHVDIGLRGYGDAIEELLANMPCDVLRELVEAKLQGEE